MWCMDWINLAQDKDRWQDLLNVVMNFRVAENAGNFMTSCGALSCSRSTLLYGFISQLVNYTLNSFFSTLRLTGKLKGPEVNIAGVKFLLPKQRVWSSHTPKLLIGNQVNYRTSTTLLAWFVRKQADVRLACWFMYKTPYTRRSKEPQTEIRYGEANMRRFATFLYEDTQNYFCANNLRRNKEENILL